LCGGTADHRRQITADKTQHQRDRHERATATDHTDPAYGQRQRGEQAGKAKPQHQIPHQTMTQTQHAAHTGEAFPIAMILGDGQ